MKIKTLFNPQVNQRVYNHELSRYGSITKVGDTTYSVILDGNEYESLYAIDPFTGLSADPVQPAEAMDDLLARKFQLN